MEKDIGSIISNLRKKKKLTQAKLAQKLNVSDRAVSNWETGKNYPDIEILAKLSLILDYDFLGCLYQNKKRKYLDIIFLIILFILIVLTSFFAFYFINNYQKYNIYHSTANNLDLGNSFLITSKDNVILEIDDLKFKEDYIINSFSLYVSNFKKEEIVFKRNKTKITLVDNLDNPKYFKKDILSNLNNLYIDINYNIDNNSFNETFKIVLTDINSLQNDNYNYLKEKANVKTLLLNNNYKLTNKDYYEKNEENLKLAYNLEDNIFYYNMVDKDIYYNINYDVKNNLIEGKTYYKNVLVMNLKYNTKTNNKKCLIGDCNYQDITNKILKEYKKIKNSS